MRRLNLRSNHGLVLLHLMTDPHRTLRRVGQNVGLTERAISSILGDLEGTGLIVRTRVGRRNEYTVNAGQLSELTVFGTVRVSDWAGWLHRQMEDSNSDTGKEENGDSL